MRIQIIIAVVIILALFVIVNMIRKKALEEGYRPLSIDGINKVLKGMTTLEEFNNKILMY